MDNKCMLCGESRVWTEAYGPAMSDKKEAMVNELGRTLDIIVVQKDKNICQIIDFACPYDGRVDTKEEIG